MTINKVSNGYIHKTFAITIVVIMGITLGIGLYLLSWPIDVLDVCPANPQINKINVYPGEIVLCDIRYSKFVDHVAFITKVLSGVDENGDQHDYSLPMTSGIFEKGINKLVTDSTCIPVYVLPGTYHIKYRGDYYINPLRNLPERFETEAFNVVRR